MLILPNTNTSFRSCNCFSEYTFYRYITTTFVSNYTNFVRLFCPTSWSVQSAAATDTGTRTRGHGHGDRAWRGGSPRAQSYVCFKNIFYTLSLCSVCLARHAAVPVICFSRWHRKLVIFGDRLTSKSFPSIICRWFFKIGPCCLSKALFTCYLIIISGQTEITSVMDLFKQQKVEDFYEIGEELGRYRRARLLHLL